MSVLDSIASLSTGTYTVIRRATGTWANGRYTKNPNSSSFQVKAVVQPAFNMNRIIGGRDLKHDEQGQHVTSVQLMYTTTELFTRTETHDPDEVVVDGATWTVTRVEKWNHTGRVFYKVVISEKLEGGA